MDDSEESSKIKQVYFIPSAITALGLCCGLFIIFKTSIKGFVTPLPDLLQRVSILLLIAIIADFADGLVARLMKAESVFGEQFDSLSDAVSFGIAPPLIIIKSLEQTPIGKLGSFFLIVSSMIYALCGLLRLVRYNVDLHKNDSSQKETKKKTSFFIGLPIPAGALLAVSTALFLSSLDIHSNLKVLILIFTLFIAGTLMISKLPFPSLKNLHFRMPFLYLLIITGIVAIAVFYSILDFFNEAFFITSWAYIFICFPLFYLRKRRQLKTPK